MAVNRGKGKGKKRRGSGKRRTGTVKVFNTAEISSSFPKSRRVVKTYKFTVYGDGRIVKKAVK